MFYEHDLGAAIGSTAVTDILMKPFKSEFLFPLVSSSNVRLGMWRIFQITHDLSFTIKSEKSALWPNLQLEW